MCLGGWPTRRPHARRRHRRGGYSDVGSRNGAGVGRRVRPADAIAQGGSAGFGMRRRASRRTGLPRAIQGDRTVVRGLEACRTGVQQRSSRLGAGRRFTGHSWRGRGVGRHRHVVGQGWLQYAAAALVGRAQTRGWRARRASGRQGPRVHPRRVAPRLCESRRCARAVPPARRSVAAPGRRREAA